ncbi:MAG: hypothetical protein PVH11_07280 [Anaerolineae bacterium]|jgi:hypothetical protein
MMNKKEVREAVAAHADQLTGGHTTLSPTISRNEQVQALLDMAENLQAILVPVKPDVDFRRRLHGELILQAQRRQSEPQATLFQQHRKGILIGAAAVGSVASVVGVAVAFVIRYRQGRASQIAVN